MNQEAHSIQAKLRQIDDYQSKGLLRAEEAESQRAALLRRLMQVLVPDTPAPRLPWRARLWAAAAMAVLVGSVAAYLLSGHAGLRRHSEELLDAGKAAAAQSAVSRRERLVRIRAGESLAPDANGVFPGRASAATTATTLPAAGSSATAVSRAGADAVAPLLSGRVRLDPGLAQQAAPDDALFIVVRLPGDPAALPLAAIRRQVGDLPLDFNIGARELVGAPARFLQAPTVVVTARISKTGSGQILPGDLAGEANPVAPWSSGIEVVIDRVLPGR